MGCRGIVRILLEKVSDENVYFDFLRGVFNDRQNLTMATLISSNNKNFNVGMRIFKQDSKITASDSSPHTPNDLLEKIKQISAEKMPEIETFDFGEVFFETLNPPLNLLLFGAGYDALPVIDFAKEIGWRVSVIDHRAAFANKERLPKADEIIVSNSEDLPDEIFADETTVAVVMTHNYDRDREILRRLMNSKCQYVGALGPKKRTGKLLAEIGEKFDETQLAKLYAPVGLDIGADTPETIALSIVAEIKAVLAQRDGGFLRNRQGSIYGQSE
ncbi:MAG: XdhC family protein [Pyrinomonadaceae bacterium]